MNLYIAKQLELRRSLSIELLCDSVNDCGRTQQLTWAEAWDEVRVEYTIDNYRPDIALLRAGRVLAAIEVLVTHEVSPEKATYFDQKKIPWLEVWASESIYEGEERWLAEQPLP